MQEKWLLNSALFGGIVEWVRAAATGLCLFDQYHCS